jgi:hypothetical protein
MRPRGREVVDVAAGREAVKGGGREGGSARGTRSWRGRRKGVERSSALVYRALCGARRRKRARGRSNGTSSCRPRRRVVGLQGRALRTRSEKRRGSPSLGGCCAGCSASASASPSLEESDGTPSRREAQGENVGGRWKDQRLRWTDGLPAAS